MRVRVMIGRHVHDNTGVEAVVDGRPVEWAGIGLPVQGTVQSGVL